jgi:hypothetical protein
VYEELADTEVLARAAAALRKVTAHPVGSVQRAVQWGAYESYKAELDRRMLAHIIAEIRRAEEEGEAGTTATPSEQVTATMRARIAAGTYPPGSRLPSARTLSQELGVATRTVRKALAPLAAEGLIETRPGWGTFIRRGDADGGPDA